MKIITEDDLTPKEREVYKKYNARITQLPPFTDNENVAHY